MYGFRGMPGFGATCTPTDCPGPYSNPQYNYDYQLEQAQLSGAINPADIPAGPVTMPVPIYSPAPACMDFQSFYNSLGWESCDPRDTACVQRNTNRDVYSEQAQIQYKDCIPVGTVAPGSITAGAPPPPVSAPAPSAPPPTAPNPSISFTTSRGGNLLQPGDTWTLQIRNALPNSPVQGSAQVNGGGMSTSNFGSTDAAGNWTLAGVITADQIGVWRENWVVGGQPVGTFSFRVMAAPTTSGKPAPLSPATPSAPGGSMTQPPAPGGGQLVTVTETSGGIPWWVWLVGGGVALYAFSGGKR